MSCQLQEHPSLLPVDFDISPVTGQLVLSLSTTPYNSVPEDLDKRDQRVPKLSNSSSVESSSSTSKVYISIIQYNLILNTVEPLFNEFDCSLKFILSKRNTISYSCEQVVFTVL